MLQALNLGKPLLGLILRHDVGKAEQIGQLNQFIAALFVLGARMDVGIVKVQGRADAMNLKAL